MGNRLFWSLVISVLLLSFLFLLTTLKDATAGTETIQVKINHVGDQLSIEIQNATSTYNTSSDFSAALGYIIDTEFDEIVIISQNESQTKTLLENIVRPAFKDQQEWFTTTVLPSQETLEGRSNNLEACLSREQVLIFKFNHVNETERTLWMENLNDSRSTSTVLGFITGFTILLLIIVLFVYKGFAQKTLEFVKKKT